MYKVLSTAVIGLAISVSPAAADPINHGPRVLTLTEMDRVTAGLQLNLATLALAAGSSLAFTSANGAGGTSQESLPGGGFVQSGVVGGTASAVANGGSTSTSVVTSGAVNGTPLVNVTVGGTVTSAVGQASFGFTYVSGGTFFIP